MPMLNSIVQSMVSLPGAVGAAVIDIASGQTLDSDGVMSADFLETVGIANARFLRCQSGILWDADRQEVEDVIVTSTDYHHLIRLIRRRGNNPRRFLYLVSERSRANLALSRMKLAEIEESLGEDGESRLMEIECDYVLDADDIRSKVARIEAGLGDAILARIDPDEDIPSFMRTDVALRLLGVSPGENNG